jgi:drug/metabolite transporter (DMT)-like permease
VNIIFIIAGIFSGISSVIGYYFYAFATKKEEISRVSALTSIYPIYVAILAAIFLGERFAASRYFGVGLVIAGAVLISYKKFFSWKTLPISMIIILILASAFWGLEQFLDKVSLNGIDVYSNLVYYMFGNLLTAIPILIFFGSYRKMVVTDLRKMNKTVKILVFVDSITWSIATFLAIIAFSLGPVTLVSAISITWPLVILLYALFLSKLMPDLLKEELGATTFLLKLVSVLLIIFGTYLVVI